jgi:hypothetical protein
VESVKRFQPGEIVIQEGGRDSCAYIILSGTAEVFKKAGDREVRVATLGKGQVFGEMGLIENRPRSATVKALNELEVKRIDRPHFNELLQKKPSVLIPIMKCLFETAMGRERRVDVIMEGQTAEAKQALGNCKLQVSKFPFLIGRDTQDLDKDVFYYNDLFIKEEKPYVVSRNHLAITIEKGAVWVLDRGSAFGTIVNGVEIGGESGLSRARLDKDENQLIIGPATSKFIFLVGVIR